MFSDLEIAEEFEDAVRGQLTKEDPLYENGMSGFSLRRQSRYTRMGRLWRPASLATRWANAEKKRVYMRERALRRKRVQSPIQYTQTKGAIRARRFRENHNRKQAT